MKEIVKAFLDSNNRPSSEKELSAGTTVYYSQHMNNGDIFNSDGNAQIGASIDTAGLTVTVACALKLGEAVGYGPYHNVLDESTSRVATFTSSKVFQASLYSQSWFNSNHLGMKWRFTIAGSISGGEKLKCEVVLS